MDVKVLLELLNKTFADEWFDYYQYWLDAKVVKGPERIDEREIVDCEVV